ncbi:PPOX class F420-dependent oxidoreductase [Rhodococcus sp. 14C212]|uniref:PPOX class F420-dependent oxidoreductase n=1 Tax=Rhodococcus sp. 14C212 TaxID=2711209 RepID=UPI0013ECAF1F|nr:PPOX class F420-dependent oxidoreductase [Rhodococcus sp. 14C212]NGP08713.1 PPOX class F420-dependent oxidoreductase [Rhodococcus sp. 14C212]
MTPTFADLAAAKYVLLTTFRKDGTPVPTAVWAAADADRLLVWTVTDSYKVKRLRRDPRITLAVCDVRGNPRSAAVPGTATVLDAAGTERARAVIARSYGILGWLTVKGSVLRRGRAGTVGIACVVDGGGAAAETGTPAPGHGG